MSDSGGRRVNNVPLYIYLVGAVALVFFFLILMIFSMGRWWVEWVYAVALVFFLILMIFGRWWVERMDRGGDGEVDEEAMLRMRLGRLEAEAEMLRMALLRLEAERLRMETEE